MLSLFRHKRQKPPPPPTMNVVEGYLSVESAHTLLAVEHRRQLLNRKRPANSPCVSQAGTH